VSDTLSHNVPATSVPLLAHPLEPLTPEEIVAAVTLLRKQQAQDPRVRFVSVTLHEPAKDEVLAFKYGDPLVRRAFVVLLDKSVEGGATYEAVINITEERIDSWRHIPGAQPSLMIEEMMSSVEIIKAHPDLQAALTKRGITDMDLVNMDIWSAGNYGAEEEQKQRIVRTAIHVRTKSDNPHENSYAHPVEGLHVVFDLNKSEVIRIEDYGVVPVPTPQGDYVSQEQPPRSLKPLEITQPEGPSFQVNGHHVTWDNWSLRLGFSPREGLILYDVNFMDQGHLRPILYRAALAEMVVPYGDTSPSHWRKNAFDVGEYGVGYLANALELGCDCLGHIYYFDAHMADNSGNPVTLPNAICMHEEDYGILWKHTNFRTNHAEVRRSRRLVISFIATVGFYDYGFFWYFYQDGTIQQETKLTGIVNVGAVQPGSKTRYGKMLNEQLYAPNHQHFFCFRLDMQVDGLHNSVVEEHTTSAPMGPENPQGNAFYVQSTLLKTEQEAQQVIDPLTARTWKVINPDKLNIIGEPVGYQLMAGSNVLPFAREQSSILQRAGFMKNHLWVTPYHPDERFPAGDYPNQHKGHVGLDEWTRANRSIEKTDIVLWHTVGAHHAPRLEDWPVMPVSYAGFMLRPHGFFDQNPALNVAPPASRHHGACCEHE
jgi:primary-amine oxidase